MFKSMAKLRYLKIMIIWIVCISLCFIYESSNSLFNHEVTNDNNYQCSRVKIGWMSIFIDEETSFSLPSAKHFVHHPNFPTNLLNQAPSSLLIPDIDE